ncbi:MAG: hypothetical protein S4CHLAM7_14070 [Chlamydiae bacterium]|nr:hypothetical protein [Chlamydiota bacterium]
MSLQEQFTSPFKVVKSRYITEKAMMLGQLHTADSNACLKKCQTPKYVFVVDKRATKKQIAAAVEEIYAEKKVKVVGVNTIVTKPKPKKVRGRFSAGKTVSIKKAIVTLDVGDVLED